MREWCLRITHHSLFYVEDVVSDGIISANSLGSRGTYTFTYMVSNPCTTDDITRKVYVEVLTGISTPCLRDTIDKLFRRKSFSIDNKYATYYEVLYPTKHTKFTKKTTLRTLRTLRETIL
jgi:hypothetical protein